MTEADSLVDGNDASFATIEVGVAAVYGGAEIRATAVDAANERLSRPEQVKAFELLGTEWTAESEELTPTLKLKRRVVNTKYSDVLDRLYG